MMGGNFDSCGSLRTLFIPHRNFSLGTLHFSCPSDVLPVHLPPLLFFKPSYILEQRGRSVQSKTSPIAYELMQDYANNCRQTMFLLSMLPRPGNDLGHNLGQEVEVQPKIRWKICQDGLAVQLAGQSG